MLIPIWVVGFAVLAGYLADQRSRSVTQWSAYGAILGPIASILVWVAPPGRCRRCGTVARGWSGTCAACGAHLRSAAAAPGNAAAPAASIGASSPPSPGPPTSAPAPFTLSPLPPSALPPSVIRPADTSSSGPPRGTTSGATGYGGSTIATPGAGPLPYRSTTYPGAVTPTSTPALAPPDITPVETYVQSMAAAAAARAETPARTAPAAAMAAPAPAPTARSKPRARTSSRKQAAAAAAAAWHPIGSGVFVTGRVALQPGSRYVLEVDETRLRARGPVGIQPSSVVLDRKLRTLAASSAGDRLVIDSTSGRSTNTILVFMSIEPTTPEAMAAEIDRRATALREAAT